MCVRKHTHTRAFIFPRVRVSILSRSHKCYVLFATSRSKQYLILGIPTRVG